MNRRLLLVIILFIIVLLVTACGGQKGQVTSTTKEVAQASGATQEPEQPSASSTPATQAGEATGAAAVPTATAEPTQASAAEQASPTQSLVNTGGSAPESTTAPSDTTQPAAAPETPACLNKAAFYEDVTIPDDTVIRQGDKFTKTWRVRNEGDCTWKDYQLVYAGGEAMNSAPSNSVPAAAPGDIIDISVDMTAPGRGGTYLSYWQFSTPGGQTFGVGSGANGLLWARIQVDYASGEETASTSTNTNQTGSSSTTTVSTGSDNNSGGNSSGGNNNSGGNSSGGNNNSGGAAPSNTPAGCNYSLNPGYENQILDLINKARADNGLGAVTRDAELDAAALEHSMDMACNDFISHTGSDGTLWYQRVAKQGFANSNSARENIYTGSPDFGGDANGAFTWWMNSKIHRDNILFDSVSVIGISYVYSAKATYGGLYTLVLARP